MRVIRQREGWDPRSPKSTGSTRTSANDSGRNDPEGVREEQVR